MYCRRHHTDGFIPKAALASLAPAAKPQGKPQQSADRLVAVHLWDVVEGGYRVHGYQQRYNDELDKALGDERRQKKREAGRKGGQASWEARRERGDPAFGASKQPDSASKQPASNSGSTTSAEAQREGRGGSGSESLNLGEKSEKGEPPPLDRWLIQLQEDYPQNRVTYGHMTSQGFFEAFQKDPRPESEVWAEMRANLENQKAGHEWRVKGMAPKLEKWLRDGLWKQRHEADPPAAPTPKPTRYANWRPR